MTSPSLTRRESPPTARPHTRRSRRARAVIVAALVASCSMAALPTAQASSAHAWSSLANGPRSIGSTSLATTATLHGRDPQQSPSSLAARFVEVLADRWKNGGTALPRTPLPPSSSPLTQVLQVLDSRQDPGTGSDTGSDSGDNTSDNTQDDADDSAITGSHGPESDQPITVGNTQITPLIIIIAGMTFSFVCCLFLIFIINCVNLNNSQTGRDRLRAQQDLRLRGAGRRSVVEPYVFGTAASGTSSPSYGSNTGHGRRASRFDRRPPPRPAQNGSISSRSPLYSSRNSHASGSVSGSDRLLLASASPSGRVGHNSFLSTSSGPFGDSQAATETPAKYSDRVAPSSRAGPSASASGSGSGSGNAQAARGYRPAPLPMPPMQQQRNFDVAPGSPRHYLYGQAARARTRSDAPSVNPNRSSTIGRGTDIYRNRGSRAYVPPVTPSAVAPVYPNWAPRDYGNPHSSGGAGGAHPLEGSSELKRHLTDPTVPGSLAASRRNSMLSLSVGSNSNEGSASPNHTGVGLLGGVVVGGGGGGGGGGGTSPDSASSSHLSTFSQGLMTNPLIPLGSSYLTSGNSGVGAGGAAANGSGVTSTVPTGDLISSGFFGSGSPGLMNSAVIAPPPPPIGQRRSPIPAVGGVGGVGSASGVGSWNRDSGAPPPPPQKSIYHARPPPGSNMSALEYGSAVRTQQMQSQPPAGASARWGSSGPYEAGPKSSSGSGLGVYSAGSQRQNDDIEAVGGVMSGGGRYARRPIGPR